MSDPKRKRPAPYCIRLSADERARLERDAGGLPLATHIKSLVSGRKGSAQSQTRVIARLIAAIGKSRVPQSLEELADAARSGSLVLTPETKALLIEAANAMIAVRRILVRALRVKDEP